MPLLTKEKRLSDKFTIAHVCCKCRCAHSEVPECCSSCGEAKFEKKVGKWERLYEIKTYYTFFGDFPHDRHLSSKFIYKEDLENKA